MSATEQPSTRRSQRSSVDSPRIDVVINDAQAVSSPRCSSPRRRRRRHLALGLPRHAARDAGGASHLVKTQGDIIDVISGPCSAGSAGTVSTAQIKAADPDVDTVGRRRWSRSVSGSTASRRLHDARARAVEGLPKDARSAPRSSRCSASVTPNTTSAAALVPLASRECALHHQPATVTVDGGAYFL